MAARTALVSLLLAGAAMLGGCATLGLGEPVEVSVAGVTPLPSTAFEHRLRIDLRLRNPNERAYRIDGIRFVLHVNGERLASGMSELETTLPRLGEVVVPVTTTTSLLDVVNQIVAFARRADAGERGDVTYELRGRLFLAGAWGGIDFERNGTLADLAPKRAARPPR